MSVKRRRDMETEHDPAVYLFHLNESTDDLDASDRRDDAPREVSQPVEVV
jgi:hypothetical protein